MTVPIPVQAALIGAVIAVLGGGLIAEWRELQLLKRESRKTLNRVLFTQLEMVHRLRRSRVEPLLAALRGQLATRFGPDDVSQIAALVSAPAITGVIQDLLQSRLSANLDAQYQNAVDAIAEVDPLLAYDLNGRNALTKYRDFLKQYFDAAQATLGLPPTELAAMVSMIVAVEEAFQSDAINEISQDAKLVAAALGRRTLRRASKVLDRPLVPDEKDFAKEFQPLIDKVMGGLVPSHSAA